MILEQLDREAELTHRALERVPKGKNDRKPHPKSMPLGQLAHMVATMPSWISMIVKQDEVDIKPKEGAGNGASRNLGSTEALLKALVHHRELQHLAHHRGQLVYLRMNDAQSMAHRPTTISF